MNFPVLFRGDQFEGDGLVLNIAMGGCSFTTTSKLAMGAIMRHGPHQVAQKSTTASPACFSISNSNVSSVTACVAMVTTSLSY